MSAKPTYPKHIRAFAEDILRENKMPTRHIASAIKAEFSVDVPATAIHWWRRALNAKSQGVASRKAPVGQTAARVDEGIAKRVAGMMHYMRPTLGGNRLGAPKNV